MKVHHVSPNAATDGGSQYFIGDVQVQPVVTPDEGIDIIVVRFSAGARTYLHSHAAPQVLHCMEGKGILATGREQNVAGPGDIVHIPAGEMHWHGATADGPFVHLSIRPPGTSAWTRTDPLA